MGAPFLAVFARSGAFDANEDSDPVENQGLDPVEDEASWRLRRKSPHLAKDARCGAPGCEDIGPREAADAGHRPGSIPKLAKSSTTGNYVAGKCHGTRESACYIVCN